MAKINTPLEKLQESIDICNNHCGCDSTCTKEQQKECLWLCAHTARMEWCIKNGIPVEQW